MRNAFSRTSTACVHIFSITIATHFDIKRHAVTMTRVEVQFLGNLATFAGIFIAALVVMVGFFASGQYNDGAVPVDFQVSTVSVPSSFQGLSSVSLKLVKRASQYFQGTTSRLYMSQTIGICRAHIVGRFAV